MTERVVYRVIAADGIQNAATGQRWEPGNLVEGTALTPAWRDGLLRDHAIEAVPWPGEETPKAKRKVATA